MITNLKMKLFAAGIFTTLCVTVLAIGLHDHDKVVCFWNSTSFERQGDAKFQVYDLHPALAHCTHLIYGFAGINTNTLEMVPLNPHIDIRGGTDFYRAVLQLKRSYHDLKVCLSIGGNADPYEETHKYLTMTRSTEARANFVDSVGRLLIEYDFDCIDLAWQFPNAIGYDNFIDNHEVEHRDGFTNLVHDLKNLLRERNNKDLTLTVLPRVNATAYYDVRSLVPNIDAIHLFTFDQNILKRNPKAADYSVSIDTQISYWLERETPGSKVVLAIPKFAWKPLLPEEILPTTVRFIRRSINDEAILVGPNTAIPGFLSYTEVCTQFMESVVSRIKRVSASSKKYGLSTLGSVNGTEAEGIWAKFEEAGNKVAHTKSKMLGGVAIYDLSLDDFRGICNDGKFPILKAIKRRFSI